MEYQHKIMNDLATYQYMHTLITFSGLPSMKTWKFDISQDRIIFAYFLYLNRTFSNIFRLSSKISRCDWILTWNWVLLIKITTLCMQQYIYWLGDLNGVFSMCSTASILMCTFSLGKKVKRCTFRSFSTEGNECRIKACQWPFISRANDNIRNSFRFLQTAVSMVNIWLQYIHMHAS